MYSFLLPYNPNNENLLEKIFFNINWNELTNEEIDLCNNELNLVDSLISNVYINKSLHKCLNNAKQQINDNEAKWGLLFALVFGSLLWLWLCATLKKIELLGRKIRISNYRKFQVQNLFFSKLNKP